MRQLWEIQNVWNLHRYLNMDKLNILASALVGGKLGQGILIMFIHLSRCISDNCSKIFILLSQIFTVLNLTFPRAVSKIWKGSETFSLEIHTQIFTVSQGPTYLALAKDHYYWGWVCRQGNWCYGPLSKCTFYTCNAPSWCCLCPLLVAFCYKHAKQAAGTMHTFPSHTIFTTPPPHGLTTARQTNLNQNQNNFPLHLEWGLNNCLKNPWSIWPWIERLFKEATMLSLCKHIKKRNNMKK